MAWKAFFSIIITLFFIDFVRNRGLKKGNYLVAFLSSLGVGSIWEILEYFYDQSFSIKMQGVFDSSFHLLSGSLQDTMFDLFSSMIGSLVCIGMVYAYERYFIKRNLG